MSLPNSNCCRDSPGLPSPLAYHYPLRPLSVAHSDNTLSTADIGDDIGSARGTRKPWSKSCQFRSSDRSSASFFYQRATSFTHRRATMFVIATPENPDQLSKNTDPHLRHGFSIVRFIRIYPDLSPLSAHFFPTSCLLLFHFSWES